MVKIIQKHDECIGCGACAAICPEHWEMSDDGKSKLKNGKIEGDKTIKEIEKLIFIDEKIDIEHIQSANDEDKGNRDLIKKEWQDVLNSIGNLMILEYNINRSIGNNSFSKKIKSYKKSNFSIVKNFPTLFPSWGLDYAKQRKEKEIIKIINFLYPMEGK